MIVAHLQKLIICYSQNLKENEASFIIHYANCGKYYGPHYYWAYVYTKKDWDKTMWAIYKLMVFNSKDPYCRLVTKILLH